MKMPSGQTDLKSKAENQLLTITPLSTHLRLFRFCEDRMKLIQDHAVLSGLWEKERGSGKKRAYT